MRILKNKRTSIGEGPIWNEKEGLLYFVSGFESEICTYDPRCDEVRVYPQEVNVAAIAFAADGRMLVTRADGAFFLDCKSGACQPLYDESIKILHCNDAKVGPDGCFYVGTQSERWRRVSDKADGRLYRITPSGEVSVVIDGLILANGMDWSVGGERFYIADTGLSKVLEYEYDLQSGAMRPTGRELPAAGADGLTVNQNDELLVALWGKGEIAVVDTHSMTVKKRIATPARIPASCAFFGEDMKELAITTATYHVDIEKDANAGFICVEAMETPGRLPYLFGKNYFYRVIKRCICRSHALDPTTVAWCP